MSPDHTHHQPEDHYNTHYTHRVRREGGVRRGRGEEERGEEREG